LRLPVGFVAYDFLVGSMQKPNLKLRPVSSLCSKIFTQNSTAGLFQHYLRMAAICLLPKGRIFQQFADVTGQKVLACVSVSLSTGLAQPLKKTRWKGRAFKDQKTITTRQDPKFCRAQASMRRAAWSPFSSALCLIRCPL